VKTFRGQFAAVVLAGFAIVPGIAAAQEQPIASVARLVPLDITGLYVVPAIKRDVDLARYDLLVGTVPFKAIAVATPAAAPRLTAACVVALVCP
jgi:hypothetical protein